MVDLTEAGKRSRRFRGGMVAAAIALAAAVPGVTLPGGAVASAAAAPGVEAVSTLPRYVSGGDVLVRVTPPDPGAAKHLRVEVDGVDVTASFHGQADGSLLGLVDGMSVGPHEIVARANGNGNGSPRGRSTTLKVVNHPITGGLFSGPQQHPFFCETTAFGLGPATDAACSAPTRVTYVYRTTARSFAPLTDPTTRPPDLAQTTTLDGRTVDYIVRLEQGTINRAVYELAALYDPAQPPSPFTAEPGWNERLVYTFGGGCNVGYHQGASTGGVLNDMFLSKGYAVASSSLNVLDNNCSDVISAETAVMVKEHFIETYGVPRYTIGWGGSGGAIQQQLIANNYPGILDGILPSASFVDATTLATVTDCRLLATYFASPAAAALGWTAEQRDAASGFGTYGSCNSWHLAFANRTNALEACPSAIPVTARYDPVTNPTGIRCTAVEQVANQLGRDPETGFVYRPLDNVGVQYGRQALEDGVITPEQFVSLNEHAGGYDVVGRVVAQRTVADPPGLERAYTTGRVNNFGLGLASTPIIDLRTYTDPVSDIHTRFWSFVARQRLLDANGTADNQAIFISNNAGAGAMAAEALAKMDEWLAAIRADTASGTSAERTIRNRPADLEDSCWTSATNRIVEHFTYQGPGACEALYPSWGDTRTAAGEGLAEDIIKCQLQPLDFADYGVTFTPDQQARLQATYPNGVCDYTQPGVDQAPPDGTWLDWSTPQVIGPIPSTAPPGDPSHDYAFYATPMDLAKVGYVEQEYFVKGIATRYSAGAPDPDAPIGEMPYETRIVVRRPVDPRQSNGAVVVDWQNVTAGHDIDTEWGASGEFFVRHGWTWVGASVQRVGVNGATTGATANLGLRQWSDDRYRDLDLTNGGTVVDDSQSFDVYTQIARLAKEGPASGPNPFAGLNVKRVFAGGVSQSAGFLIRYYNGLQASTGVFDGFLVGLGGGSPSASVGTKLFKVYTETDVRGQVPLRVPDGPTTRTWEIAGGSHVPASAVDPDPADFRAVLGGIQSREFGPSAPLNCVNPGPSEVEVWAVFDAAYAALNRWVARGVAPAAAPPIAIDPGPPVTVQRDSDGIALGGLRLPSVSVPVALNNGVNAPVDLTNPLNAFCVLFGTHRPFDDATLAARYPSHRSYVAQVDGAASALVDRRLLLPEDAVTLRKAAAQSPIGR
jgi:hypothetical protein